MRNWRTVAVGLGVSILVAALYAVAYFFDTFDEQYLFHGDNYQVLATIVADRNPGYFDADPVLGDLRNYSFYRTAFTALVDWTYGWLGNPGQVYGVLAIPFNVLRVFGFFLLGLRLFRSPGWALVLAIASAIEVRFSVFQEWWGIPSDTLARTAYESLFPCLLLGAITANARLGPQTVVMIAGGMVTYLHPVSGPPVAFALWAAMLVRNGDTAVTLRLRNAAVTGVAYALAILPFFVHFRDTTRFGNVTFDALDAALLEIYQGYMNLGGTRTTRCVNCSKISR